jgi:hypothetical protein
MKISLFEERIFNLLGKTKRDTPKLAGRADFITPKYIGLDKTGIFHFKTNSQSRPGNVWYQTVEIKNLKTLANAVDNITPDLVKQWFETADVNIMCGCFTKGNKVLTADNIWKDISEIKEGDTVINKNGKPTIVKEVATMTSDIIYTIEFNGNTIRCTPDHRFLVKRTLYSHPEWIEAKDLTTDMYLLDIKKVIL